MDKVISRTISEIEKVKNENLELNDKLSRARAENERLKKISCKYKEYCTCDTEKFIQALQEVRELMHENDNISGCEYCYGDIRYSILAKINEVIGAE